MSIAQEIRNAAIEFELPIKISDQARAIVGMFFDDKECLVEVDLYRTLMLFVAEELSPSLPVDDLLRIAKSLDSAKYVYHYERRIYANRLRDLVRGM